MSPNQPDSLAGDSMAVAAAISQTARKGQWTVAVVESLTSGSLSCHLGAAESSSEWYLGGVTAYSSEVKFKVLGVDRGPVITARCAEQMAAGVAKLTEADFSVAVTGAGGPGQEEGKPAGTVFIAVYSADGTHIAEHHFTGDASHVVQQTTLHALRMLDAAIGGLIPPAAPMDCVAQATLAQLQQCRGHRARGGVHRFVVDRRSGGRDNGRSST